MPAGVANGFIVDCVFTHISGDSSACSSADIHRVEERERRVGVLLISDVGSNFNPFRDSVSNSPYIHSLKSVFWHKLLQNFKLPIYKTGHYGPFYCLFMKLYQWSLDRDGRIYRSIINCSKLPCSGVWRAGAEASPLQPRPQVRPRAGGHEAGAPQQAHRWLVGCDWWRAGHVTALLLSDWSSPAALPAGDWKRFLIKTPPSYDGSFADADLQKFRPDPTPSPLEDPWYGQWLT